MDGLGVRILSTALTGGPLQSKPTPNRGFYESRSWASILFLLDLLGQNGFWVTRPLLIIYMSIEPSAQWIIGLYYLITPPNMHKSNHLYF